MPTPEVPPYIQWIDRWGIGGADQYNRYWEWYQDADGNSKLGYRDADGRFHETYKGSDGFWYETFTDKDGNTHLGQVDDAGNVHDGWMDASGTNYDQVRPPEEVIGREQSSGASSLVEEVPPVGQQPEAEPPVQPNPAAEPPVEQSPTPNPPAVPGGEGGIPGMGVPYQDFIPLYPMVQDPATGEWRNAQPGEIPKPEPLPEGRDVPPGGIPKPEPLPPNEDVDQSFQVIDPETGEVISSKPGDPPGSPIDVPPGEVRVVTEDVNPYDDFLDNIQKAGSNLPKPPFFTTAPDTASDVPGGAEQQQPQGIDPNLLDSIAPGPTLDTGLVERITQSPGLVEAVNQDPSVAEALERDPTQIDQIEQDLSVVEHQRPMELSGDLHPNFADPSFTEQPSPDQSTPDEGADDLTL